MENKHVINNEARKRFELEKNGKPAFIEYKIMGDKILLLSTQVPEELSGQGVGSKLAGQTFEIIETMDLKVVPICSFIQGWLKKHPEKQHLLA